MAIDGLRKTPPYWSMTPVARRDLLAFVEPENMQYVNHPHQLVALYRSDDPPLSITYYFEEANGGSGAMFMSCGNEFGTGWGNCIVEYDVNKTTSIKYMHCLAMLPHWREFNDAMVAVTDDFTDSAGRESTTRNSRHNKLEGATGSPAENAPNGPLEPR